MPKSEKATAADPRVTSKSRFARIINVSPGRITDYIAKGQIRPESLEGTGRSARIIVAKAKADLLVTLDSGQRSGNGLGTKLKPSAPAPSLGGGEPSGEDPVEVDGAELSELDEDIKREKLAALQRANRKAAAEEALARGRYTLTEDCRKQINRVAARSVRVYEAAIPEIATTIAGRFKLDVREVTIVVGEAFRDIRAAESTRAFEEIEGMPKFVDDPDEG